MTHALDLFKLDGMVALVTGGGRGLGYFAAEALAEAGADVAICGRNVRGKLAEAADKLKAIGSDSIAIKCDVTQEDDVIQMAAAMKDHYGRCDILVNNAGVGMMGPTETLSLEVWNNLMNVNLAGTFLCCREIGKMMIEQKSGNIINFSSENGQVGFAVGMTPYAATKIGIVGMTRSLAAEWGKHNIRVNAILPGNMEEGMMEMLQDRSSPFFKFAGEAMLKMTPLHSFGIGDDIKGAIVFMASQASRYVSGAMIVVDGGFTINAGL